MARVISTARASNRELYGGTNHDQPRMSPSPSVCTVKLPRPGTGVSSAILAGANQVEVIGRATLTEDQLTRVEAHICRTPDHQLQIARVHPAEERMLGQNAL